MKDLSKVAQLVSERMGDSDPGLVSSRPHDLFMTLSCFESKGQRQLSLLIFFLFPIFSLSPSYLPVVLLQALLTDGLDFAGKVQLLRAQWGRCPVPSWKDVGRKHELSQPNSTAEASPS